MNYEFTEEQLMIREICDKIGKEKIVPVRAEYDETGKFPWDIVKILSDSDVFRVYLPEEYGGMGGGCLEMCIATETLSKYCGGIALAFAATGLGSYPILLYGTEEQKKRYLPDIAAGKKLTAFGLTESNAGSDVGGIQTTAVEDGDYYVLNGTKQWITNGGEAEIYSIIAATNKAKGARGLSAFIVEKGTKGFSFGKKEDKMGIRASVTSELIFEDCKIPRENMLGRKGAGFMVSMKTFDKSRPGVGAQALGIAQGAFEEAVKFARERVQFEKPIASFQGIQFMLADMATKIEAARTLIYQAARDVDSGDKNISKISAMAKMFASDTAMEVTTDAVQIMGGNGYMKEYPVEKMMRDAKITQIYEGTNQIQRGIIAMNIIKEGASI